MKTKTGVFRAGLFAGKTAIVSGGGSGIGFDVARQLFGLGANALQARAVRSIYSAKGRDPGNPVIAHVADVESALRCYDFGAGLNGGGGDESAPEAATASSKNNS